MSHSVTAATPLFCASRASMSAASKSPRASSARPNRDWPHWGCGPISASAETARCHFPMANSISFLAAHAQHYCDEGEEMKDNLREYARVLKPGGTLIASVADSASYIFDAAERLADGSYRIARDHYGQPRRLPAALDFPTRRNWRHYFSGSFEGNFSSGHASNDYFGIGEKAVLGGLSESYSSCPAPCPNPRRGVTTSCLRCLPR